MTKDRKTLDLLFVFLVYSSWLLIDSYIFELNHIYNFRKIHPYLLSAVNMTLMFLVTYLYVKFYEKQNFKAGFNFAFQKIGKNILWAFIFFLVAGVVLMGYQFLIVRPLTQKMLTASGGISEQVVPPLWSRIVEFLYIVYEGVIEVFIFTGFLLDRLAKAWKWPLALVVSNIGFALWHFSYWNQGWLEGSLMMLLTFLAGIFISLSYVKTRNSLSPVICHTLVDGPNSIRTLLGIMH